MSAWGSMASIMALSLAAALLGTGCVVTALEEPSDAEEGAPPPEPASFQPRTAKMHAQPICWWDSPDRCCTHARCFSCNYRYRCSAHPPSHFVKTP